MRAQTDSAEAPGRRYPRAASRPVTDLGALAHGEPRIEELLALYESASETSRRTYILLEIARVYTDDLSDPAAAAVALRAALQEDCDHDPVVARLAELTSEIDGWSELLAELMEDAAALGDDDPRRAADLWVRIARWYDDPVNHREFATHAVRQALELVPHHTRALSTLASFLREDEYWVELVGVLQRLAAVTSDDAERIELWLSVADLADVHLGDHATAIAACRAALDLDGACQPAFDALRALLRRTDAAREVAELLEQRSALIDDPDEHLELAIEIARIYDEQLGDRDRAERAWSAIDDHRGAIEHLGSMVASETDPEERARLHHRIACFWLQSGEDERRAEWHFSQALADCATHVPSLGLLANVYRLRGDFRKATVMLDRAADAAPDPTEYVLDSARIYADELGDLAGAAALCERTLAARPQSTAIARMLASVYARLERWADLQPLLIELERELVRDDAAPEEIRSLYYLIARSAAELGDDDRALAYYYESRTIAPDDPEVLRGLADQYFTRSQWHEAAREYGALLANGALPRDEAAVQYRLGVALRNAGDDRPAALEAFRRVVELEPDHLPALEATGELLVALGHWRAAARVLEALVDLAPPEDRARVMIELGDVHRDHLDQPRRALELYSAAVERAPGDHAALQRRLDVASALRAWPVAIDTIERFAAVEPVAARRGSYYHAAAVIYRDELAEVDRAADLFDRALDAFFAEPGALEPEVVTRYMKPFVDLDAMMTAQRDFAGQARAYRRMIRRLAPGNPVLGDLWHALGEIYRSRLKRYPEAAAAFEVARDLAPDNLERRAILAELYQRTNGGTTTAAADEHHRMLAIDPTRADSYRALKDIHLADGHMDQAWCACRALVFLERATPAEAELYRRYQSTTLAEFRARISADLRGRLTAGDSRSTVVAALGLVRSAIASARPSALSIDPGQAINPRKDKRARARLLAHAAAAFDVPEPRIYDQEGRKGPLAFGLCVVEGALRPVMAARREFFAASDKIAAFAAGRALCLLDPDRVLSVMFTDAELAAIVRWILGRGEPDAGDRGAPALRKLLDRTVAPALRPDQREQLARARRELADTDWRAELDAWRRAVVTSADRAGFLACGDLTEAARMVARSRTSPAGLEPAARILELVRYSVTDEHAEIRRRLCGRV